MTSNNFETELIRAVGERRAARRTTRDDGIERWLAATGLVLTLLSIIGVVRWVFAYV